MDSLTTSFQVTFASWKHSRVSYTYGLAPKCKYCCQLVFMSWTCYLATKCSHLFSALLMNKCWLPGNQFHFHHPQSLWNNWTFCKLTAHRHLKGSSSGKGISASLKLVSHLLVVSCGGGMSRNSRSGWMGLLATWSSWICTCSMTFRGFFQPKRFQNSRVLWIIVSLVYDTTLQIPKVNSQPWYRTCETPKRHQGISWPPLTMVQFHPTTLQFSKCAIVISFYRF